MPKKPQPKTPDIIAVEAALSGTVVADPTHPEWLEGYARKFLAKLNQSNWFVISTEELASQNERAYLSGHTEGWTTRASLDA